MNMKPKSIALLILGFALLVILLQNTEVVSFRIFFWKIAMSRIILFPLVIFIGVAAGFIIGKSSR